MVSGRASARIGVVNVKKTDGVLLRFVVLGIGVVNVQELRTSLLLMSEVALSEKDTLAQSNLCRVQRASCSEHLRRALVQSNWRRALAQSSLRRAACTEQHSQNTFLHTLECQTGALLARLPNHARQECFWATVF